MWSSNSKKASKGQKTSNEKKDKMKNKRDQDHRLSNSLSTTSWHSAISQGFEDRCEDGCEEKEEESSNSKNPMDLHSCHDILLICAILFGLILVVIGLYQASIYYEYGEKPPLGSVICNLCMVLSFSLTLVGTGFFNVQAKVPVPLGYLIAIFTFWLGIVAYALFYCYAYYHGDPSCIEIPDSYTLMH